MKNLIKIFILMLSIGVSMATYAQGDAKHAINTKGAGSNDRALPTCPDVDRETEVEIQMALKTRTKSNNANERTNSPGHKTVGEICLATVPDVQPKILVFKWRKDSMESPVLLRVWQLKGEQNYINGKTPENLVLEDKGTSGSFFIEDKPIRRPRDLSNAFVWEIQPVDAAGKPAGTPHFGMFKLIP